jgi:hypothetical protein
MAIAVGFTSDLTTQQYDEIWRQLREAKADHPNGRLSHVGFERGGTMSVVDVWDSRETFEAFGATLMPIIGAVGGTVTPEITEVHHFQAG